MVGKIPFLAIFVIIVFLVIIYSGVHKEYDKMQSQIDNLTQQIEDARGEGFDQMLFNLIKKGRNVADSDWKYAVYYYYNGTIRKLTFFNATDIEYNLSEGNISVNGQEYVMLMPLDLSKDTLEYPDEVLSLPTQ